MRVVRTKQIATLTKPLTLLALLLTLGACVDSTSEEPAVEQSNKASQASISSNSDVSKSDAVAITKDSQSLDASTANESVRPDISRIVNFPTSDEKNRQWTMAKLSTPGRIEHVEQRPGDPVEGRRALLEGSYVSCGLPERIYRNLSEGIQVTEISGRDENADGLPFSVNRIVNKLGVPTVANNCLTCHGTELFGELVIGLGNEFLDFTQDSSALVERAGALVVSEAESLSWEHYADRIAAISPYTTMHTIGVNPANNLTFALIAHRDPSTNAWSDSPFLTMPPTDPPPVSVPPWWRMKKKPAMFNLGEGRGDHARIMMAASMLCTDDIETLREIDEYAPDLLAYIRSIEPPKWPFPVNAELAESGQRVFEGTCSGCHGTYGDKPDYPARLVPLEIVNTDPLLVEFALNEGVAYVDWFNRSFFGQLSIAAPGAGYVAPPLDGVWATAPFLHNGSVPSIRAMLDSTVRPSIWRHKTRNALQPERYDQDDIGWKFEHIGSDQLVIPKPIDVYDTRLPGYSNRGHQFGDHLDNKQRTAVLEYLKTL